MAHSSAPSTQSPLDSTAGTKPSVTLPGSEEVYRLMLKAMPVGLEVRLPSDRGMVKRHTRTDYCLFDDHNKTRSRWGTLEEIAKDIDYFEANGKLPEQDMPRW